jgi:hypothetical protein
MNTTNTTDTELAGLQAGLVLARLRGPKLSASKSGAKRIRAQLFLSPAEHASIGLVGSTLAFHLGRPISRAIVTRLALYRLVTDAHRSLNDPVLAARMKAEVLVDVRDGRIKAAP